MSKQFWAVIIAIILVFVGVYAVNSNKDKSTSSGPVTATQHVIGTTANKVTLVEYGDFQCQFCEQYEPTVAQVREAYKDKVQFQFRNFPLRQIHRNALAAARAGEAASLQGKFWEMHDALYAYNNWSVWTVSNSPTTEFESYATKLGLDVAKFKTDFASSHVNDTINADIQAGNALGITGTPSFFLNGKQVSPKPDFNEFKNLLDAELIKNETQKS
jgi:protein-disulfide isomerase